METHPGWLTLNNDFSVRGTPWFISTVILTSLGFYMWPQSMAALYSAHSEEPIRRNAIFLPFYQLLLLLVYFAGWTALLVIPGLAGRAMDESFMLVVQRYYPPWVLGFVAAAGCLAGLVPASVQLLATASILSKNVLADQLGIACEGKSANLGKHAVSYLSWPVRPSCSGSRLTPRWLVCCSSRIMALPSYSPGWRCRFSRAVPPH